MSQQKFQSQDGKVQLVGAGPGDPELITVKGSRALETADVIVYDRLANPDLLSITSEESEHIYVGKRPGKPSVSQDQINHILITKAREGKKVVRLKGGDSFVFGRGGEECMALKAADIPYEVVPGISSALAAPAFAGIPVTHRKVARSFTVVTGHTIKKSDSFEEWEHLAKADTLVILMGMRNLPNITERLISFGRDADTPAAVIEKATYESQQTVVATLATIADEAAHLSSPATIVVGELASKGKELNWFQKESIEQETTTNEKFVTNFAG
ncbi:uroporphyrinogen-III C-methyltransferase [Aliifodinibius sp. S!AR15-10]|uniref:uroporphyrinogen-III C-methyltransferase n=1 Tax=Aliifodinibius sp. S!AR15-10 TaxID=2950437 RepID=UPI00285A1A32|nr:uroporphyrinogen-III C-methyltransferase [Aliifodinibius sp. S!AR15-10]MDR8392273.1 uroporphyrinogen-III C-methyltransferase [Aliifodinibius sp. S!AR15-10]